MIKTFKRYEKKYMLNNNQCRVLRDKLKEYMIEDKFGTYTIQNLYFDTDNYELIRRSVEKPLYKEKLRVRCYGTPQSEDEIFFELKKKYKKQVYKRRVCMSLNEFEDYVYRGIKPNNSEQILKEIEYFINMYNPYPRIYIAYDRAALVGKEDESLRITFDRNIRFRIKDLTLRNTDDSVTILDEDQCIMEIKVSGAMPVWLCSILNEMKVYPQSFSKYGYCYNNYLGAALA